MDDLMTDEPEQFRKSVLAQMRMEGGKSYFKTLRVWEYNILEQMVQEGIIEQDHGRPKTLGYRLPMPAEAR